MAATISGSGTSTLIDLTTSGNTTLGDATTDTLTVGVTGIVKDSSGNVGIGTTSPSTYGQLAVYTAASNTEVAAVTGGANYCTFSLRNSSIRYSMQIRTDQSNAWVLRDETAGVNRFLVDTNGDSFFGTTQASATNTQGMYLKSGASDTYAAIGHATGTGSGNGYMIFLYAGGAIGTITQNGTTGVLYNLTSDYRLKNNQQPLTGAKDFIMALKPKKWQWWDGSGEGVGFVAHEFMEVAKYSGQGEKDAVDENGKPKYQSIQPSSSEVMANMVSLIQEQQALITQLQADVAALKGTP
jgi:hypothetical protein